jgi:hypothetical protein
MYVTTGNADLAATCDVWYGDWISLTRCLSFTDFIISLQLALGVGLWVGLPSGLEDRIIPLIPSRRTPKLQLKGPKINERHILRCWTSTFRSILSVSFLLKVLNTYNPPDRAHCCLATVDARRDREIHCDHRIPLDLESRLRLQLFTSKV